MEIVLLMLIDRSKIFGNSALHLNIITFNHASRIYDIII